MQFTVAALIGHDARDRVEVRLPGLSERVFRGPSPAELLDDAALHLMEDVPRWSADRLRGLSLNPEITLRRLTVSAPLAFGPDRRTVDVKARLTAVCTRWSADGAWEVRVPRLAPSPFPVPGLGELEAGLLAWLARWARAGTPEALEAARSLRDERLELLDVDLELPSVLPSRRPRPRRARGPEPAPEAVRRAWVPAVELRQVGVDLTHRALDGRLHPALGRDELVSDLVSQLRAPGTHLLLVGEPGVGKTAIVEAVAARFAAEGKPLQERTDLWRVDGARLIAGMSWVGGWEARLARVVDELVHRRDVLVVDDLPSLAWTGRSAQSETTMAGYLLPHLRRGELRVLAECTPERLAAGRLKDPGFFEVFRVIHVRPTSDAETARILLAHLRQEESRRPVALAPDGIEAALALARRFGPRLAEPGRSVTLFRRFLRDADAERRDALGRARVGRAELVAHVARATGIPRFALEPGAGRPPDALRAAFADHVVGQDAALDALVDVVASLQEGVNDPERPVASLLFVGPTGVGKTESAKALAQVLYGDPARLLRFDMSEIQGTAGLERLVGGPGAPDGDLTRAVANQPFSVVLLDEIEKAGPLVFDLLLQVLGEGRLTNAVGRTTDFRGAVVILTSNLGVATARRRTGFQPGDRETDDAHYRAAAAAFFRPELYNRLDRVVPFRALGRREVEPLVERVVARVLGRRGLRRAGVVVRVDDALRDHLAREGFDPAYGARALQRVIERDLTVPLARLLVERPPGPAGAFVDLWWDADGPGLAIDPLVDAPSEGRDLARPDDWPALAARHARLGERLDALEALPAWGALRSRRADALARAAESRGSRDAAGWDALAAWGALVEELERLRAELADFANDRLAAFEFADRWEVDRQEHRWFGTRRRLVSRAEPIPVDRSRTRAVAAAELLALELRVGALAHRVRHLDDDGCFVLRFEPLHDDGEPFAEALAARFRDAWAEWGPLEPLRDGPTRALASTIPGLRALLAPELGLYVDAHDVGADRRLRVVRVEAIEGGPEPEAALVARGAELARGRAERRRDPLPPVVRRFHRSTAGAPTESTDATSLDQLPDLLRRTCLMRVT